MESWQLWLSAGPGLLGTAGWQVLLSAHLWVISYCGSGLRSPTMTVSMSPFGLAVSMPEAVLSCFVFPLLALRGGGVSLSGHCCFLPVSVPPTECSGDWPAVPQTCITAQEVPALSGLLPSGALVRPPYSPLVLRLRRVGSLLHPRPLEKGQNWRHPSAVPWPPFSTTLSPLHLSLPSPSP